MTTTLTPNRVHSADGTVIAYEARGDGPAIVIVDGALCHRAFGPSRKIAAALEGFTVYTYDRRGRGDSGAGETPYHPQREVEDIAAVIDAAGGTAVLVGLSSGAILAADAFVALDVVSSVVSYEPPIVTDGDGPVAPADYDERVQAAVDAGRPGDAVRIFLRHVGAPAPMVAIMRLLPMWKKLAAVGHTLRYDSAVVGDAQNGRPLTPGRWTRLNKPALVLTGGKSPVFFDRGGRALAAELGADYDVLAGQTHRVKAPVLAAAVREFVGR